MAITFTAISTVEIPVGGQPTIDFQNIPSTYTDLLLLISAREETAASATLVIDINGSSANRSEIKLQANAGGTPFSNSTNDFQIIANPSNYTANAFGSASFYIGGYASNTTKNIGSESFATNNSGSDMLSRMTAHRWADTSAINRVTIKINPGTSGGDINQYSTTTLYGIKNTV